MTKTKKPKAMGHWRIFENCQKEAKKYSSRKEFNKNASGAYDSARDRGWLDLICKHMISNTKPMGYWNNFEKCQKEALKFQKRSDFYKNAPGATNAAKKHGWTEQICRHMEPTEARKGYWQNFETCQLEALKYKTKAEFRKHCPSAIGAAKKNGWHEEICSHMEPLGSKYKRAIYAYEFADKSVYVGLTFNYSHRHSQHLASKSHIGKKLRITKFSHKQFKVWHSVNESQVEETRIIEEYRQNGWKILNRAKPGGIGSNMGKWSLESCREVAKKCKSRKEFMDNFSSGYQMSLKHGWLDEICSHMKTTRKRDGHWNIKENCITEAKKFKLRIDFLKGSPSAYNSCRKHGWLKEAYEHMELSRKPKLFWNDLKNLRKEAKKYKTRNQFKRNSTYVYGAAIRLKLLDTICAHMKSPNKPSGYWNKIENCLAVAKKYKTKRTFAEKEYGAYRSAIRNGFLSKICTQMKWSITP